MSTSPAEMSLVSASDVGELKTFVNEVLTKILPPSGSASGGAGDDSRVFKSGLELIGLKFKIGTQVEISIVFAGKDAPKLEPLVLPGSNTLAGSDTLPSGAAPATAG